MVSEEWLSIRDIVIKHQHWLAAVDIHRMVN